MRKIVILSLITLCAVLLLTLSAHTDGGASALSGNQQSFQQKEKVIEEKALSDSSAVTPLPVSIVEFSNQASAFHTGKAALTGEDWLTGLGVSIRNNSAKVITHAALKLCAPTLQTADRDPDEPCTFVSFGAFYPLTQEGPTIRISPGDVASASFSETGLNSLGRFDMIGQRRSPDRLIVRWIGFYLRI
jgi:hypothetical protein